ncbi:MAG: NfeD family protein [Intestinimonas sp.]|nr:NfeD family protein [Intestinimonas sp.]
MIIFWLAALILFGIVEAITVGLASIWFAAGAVAALIVSALTGPLWAQITIFFAVSIVCLLMVRPLSRKYLDPTHQATNADRIIGTEGMVTEEINNLKAQGRVFVAGTSWTARSQKAEQVIPAGATVRILRIEGVKVLVEPVPSDQAPNTQDAAQK